MNKITAKDFFLNLGLIISFYASIVALVVLLFRVISVAFPAMRTATYYGSSSISFQVATLIVAFPLFLLLAWLLQKSYIDTPELRDSWLRKWLSYITLFVSGAVLAGDLVTVIYMFLDGRELTTGFLLKVLAVIVIAGGVFAYYLREVRNIITNRERKVWRIVAVLIVLASIILGFSVVGSPAYQRSLRQDSQRLSDLQSIQWQIINYYQSKESLPGSLEEIRDPLLGWSIPRDPETNEPYEYILIGQSAKAFELCATFDEATPSRGNMPDRDYSFVHPTGPFESENWNHPAGRHCFDRTIDPDFYPVRKPL